MMAGAVARRYAHALIEIATGANLVDQMEKELAAVIAFVDSTPELQKALYHPQVVAAEKKALLGKVFASEISEVTQKFLNLLIDRRREAYLQPIYEEYQRLANELRNLVDAQVTSAAPLSGAEAENLEQVLAKITGKKVRFSTKVDDQLIGGVVVKIGDKIIDGSVAGKLKGLQENLRKIQVRG